MAEARPLSPAVTRVLEAHVDSLEALELLLYARRHSDETFTASTVSRDLGRDGFAIDHALTTLVRTGVLVPDSAMRSGYRFRTATADEVAAIDELAAVYAADPLSIVTWLAESALHRMRDRVRGAAARAFAAAFRIRDDEEG